MQKKKKIVVIGSGPGGVASAMVLSARGFDVTLYEKMDRVGGRTSSIQVGDSTMDVGPTFLMMKFLLDDLFEEAHAKSEDYLEFVKLDPMYELLYKGKSFMPGNDAQGTKDQIDSLFPGHSNGFDTFMKHEKKRFDSLLPALQRDYSNLGFMLDPQLFKSLPHLSLNKSVFDVLMSYFKNEDLALLFSFQSKYLGMSAWDCPGGFSMLSYIEHAFGIYHTIGGLAEIPTAMAKVAEKNGTKIHLNTAVKQLILDGKKVIGVELENGQIDYCDDIVLNGDFAQAMNDIVPEGVLQKYSPENLEKLQYSCSTFMMYLEVDKLYPLQHHTIVFADDYKKNVNEIFTQQKYSEDISFYIRNASVTDQTLSPVGKSGLYILVPTPNLDGDISWEASKAKLESKVISEMKSRLGMHDIEQHITAKKVFTPHTWKEDYTVYKGATFNLAHSLKQLAFWRPRNKFEELENCYLVGGGTHPGSGLPTIFESARISSNLLCKKHGVQYNKKKVAA